MSFFKQIQRLFNERKEEKKIHGDWYYYNKILSKLIVKFYNTINTATAVKTSATLTIENLKMNASVAEVKSLWGKPRCEFSHNYNGNNIDILFYRRNYVYDSTLFQLQFINNQLFFIAIEISNKIQSSEKKISTICNYLPELVTDQFSRIEDIPVFVDNHHNYLLVNDEVALYICYLNGHYTQENTIILQKSLIKQSSKN